MKKTITKQWKAYAPSNIALIKYVGKKEGNLPFNPSLSYTLKNLISTVIIRPSSKNKDTWAPLDKNEDPYPLHLNPKQTKKYLHFFQSLKKKWNIKGTHVVQSGNSFPHSCGIASSASSFCALTKACYAMYLDEIAEAKKYSLSQLSALSRLGSGSSCRSFFAPWAVWNNEKAQSLTLPLKNLIHQVVLTSKMTKPVSSSAAHLQVLDCARFKGRPKKATQRLDKLVTALKARDWKSCFPIVWEEFEDIHLLYENATPPIHYRTKKTFALLEELKKYWNKKKDGPLVTMDAGSAVHLLFRPDQKKMAAEIKHMTRDILNSPE